MHLRDLVEKQIAADQQRGFLVTFPTDAERQTQLTKDLVGLLGELGEFANIIKKLGLALDHPNYEGPSFATVDQQLREELADTLIYILRLSAILGADLEADVLEKITKNEARYSNLGSQ